MSNIVMDGVEYTWVEEYPYQFVLKPLAETKKGATPPPPPKNPEKGKCIIHTPVQYVGFTETYDYCEKCDAKYKDGQWVK